MSSPVTRRTFLRGAAGAGVGAAAASVSGGLLSAALPGVADAVPIKLHQPPLPTGHRNYISRPDLKPPVVNITRAGNFTGSPKYIFLSPRQAPFGQYPAGAGRGNLILDDSGDVIWFQRFPPTGADALGLKPQRYKGESVLTWWEGVVGAIGYGLQGTYVIANNRYQEIERFHAIGYGSDLHEILLTDSDTAYVCAYVSDKKLDLVIGHVQEIDVASKTLLWDWASYPTVSPSESFTGKHGDYFHLNSVDIWPGGNVLISGRNVSAVYLVSKATKRVIWQVGGKKSSFHIGPGAQFEFQHDARALAGATGISVFDDASQPSPEKQSWGKVINLNFRTRQATLRHEYNHSTAPIDVSSQGNLQLLPNGGHFIGYGANPYFSEFAPGPQIQTPQILDGRMPHGVESYRAYKFDWTGNPPLSELALVVHRGASPGSFNAFASWNGHTDIVKWTIDAGTSTNNLVNVHTSNKLSFETRLDFTHSGATQFRATAWDASGHALGSSPVVGAT